MSTPKGSQSKLKAEGIRASADLSSERMNAKIRNAQLMKVPVHAGGGW